MGRSPGAHANPFTQSDTNGVLMDGVVTNSAGGKPIHVDMWATTRSGHPCAFTGMIIPST